MSWKYAVILFVLVFIAGVAAGVIVSFRKDKNKKRPFSELLDQSLAVNEVRGADCKEWFAAKDKEFPGKNLGILNYAAKDVIEALGYECPEDVDLQHYLIQLLVTEDKKKCLAYRLINFETIAPNLKEAIGTSGMLVTLC